MPGAVAGAGIRADGTAVLEVTEGLEGRRDDVVPGRAAQGRDHGQAAGVLLTARVVETLRRGNGAEPFEGCGMRHEYRPHDGAGDGTSAAQGRRGVSARCRELGLSGGSACGGSDSSVIAGIVGIRVGVLGVYLSGVLPFATRDVGARLDPGMTPRLHRDDDDPEQDGGQRAPHVRPDAEEGLARIQADRLEPACARRRTRSGTGRAPCPTATAGGGSGARGTAGSGR